MSLAILFAGLFVSLAQAGVSGFAQWNYKNYQRDLSDNTLSPDVDAASFTQAYGLTTSYKTLLHGGRAGHASLNLGYQWISLDASVNDEDYRLSDGKFVYDGEFVLAPGGLPLRLSLFSRDTAAPTTMSTVRPYYVSSTIETDLLSAGTSTETGITFWGGIKNGSYLGQYREVLSQFPKLLIDYREVVNKSDKSLNKVDTRLRDLAFISLNKKDNWFHYRVTEYEDRYNPQYNFENREYMLGTIDHTYRRQWINLTNWIQVSVDGALTQEIDNSGDRLDSYNLNFFSIMTRRAWQLTNFTRFERTVDEHHQITKDIDVPLFAHGQIDGKNSWRMSLMHSSSEALSPEEPVWNEHLSSGTFQLESYLPSGLVRTSRAALDMKRGTNESGGNATLFGVEMRTDSRLDQDWKWLADYSIAWFNDQKNDGSYLEQGFLFSGQRRTSTRMLVGGQQILTVGFGDYAGYSTGYLTPALSGDISRVSNRELSLSGTSWRSLTSGYLELVDNRWKNRFQADLDHYSRNFGDQTQFNLQHVLTYSGPQFTLNSKNFLGVGDALYLPTYNSDLNVTIGAVGTPDYVLSNTTAITYAPLRSWSTSGEAELVWIKGDQGHLGIASLDQNSVYTLFSATGMRRKLLSLEQEAYYSQILSVESSDPNVVEDRAWYAGMRLRANLFPHPLLTVGLWSDYRFSRSSDSGILEYGCNLEVPFQKLLVSINYEYARAGEGASEGQGITEHLWEVDVKKIF